MPKSDKGVPSAGGGIAAMHNPKRTSLANYVMSCHVIPDNIRKKLLQSRSRDYSSSSDSERVYPSSSNSDSSSSSDSD